MEEIRGKIRELGEEPPMSWKKPQLQARLQELKEEHGSDMTLKKDMSNLSRHSKKKDLLKKYLTEELGVTITHNETIPQLLSMGEKAIHLAIPPTGQDLMGWGKHSQCTYMEVANKDPQYVNWRRAISKEESTCWRMTRFLKWINQEPPATNTTRKPPVARAKASTMGYQSDSSHFSVVDMPVPSSGFSDSEDTKTPEEKVASLEEQIHELRRQQALIKKDSNMDTSEGKNRKMENQK